MLFSIKRPQSQRQYQLNFEGFRIKGRSKLQTVLLNFNQFCLAIFKYLLAKLTQLAKFLFSIIRLISLLPGKVKAFTIKKLIWSRGRLGRPVATFVIMFVSFIVFTFGEVFNSSKFVNSQELSADYLANVTDIIPRRNIATTVLPESRKSTESFEYTVQSGDSLSSIGNKFKISIDALKYVNSLTGDYLKVGQVLTIPPVSGLIHKVESGDTLSSIASKYDVPAQAIADFNYILDTASLAVGTELVVPGAKVPQPVYVPPVMPYAAIPPQAAPSGKGFCVWPTTVNYISQYFSWYHNGVDIATPWARGMPPLFACNSGVVTRSGWDPWGLGLHVRIDHGNGYETVYGHMSKIHVGYGESVSRGQTIGIMGNTGRSTGPHVHFMVQYQGVAQNPMGYF